jgi:HEAT repeat protein
MAEQSEKNIDQLVADFRSEDPVKRQEARAALAEVGSAAVAPLSKALGAPQPVVRWEAAKALEQIADPTAAANLAAALADEDPDVRWVVGEALIALRREAVKPLLQTLVEGHLGSASYKDVHHVLHDLARRSELTPLLESVLTALEKQEPELPVPVAAAKALESL